MKNTGILIMGIVIICLAPAMTMAESKVPLGFANLGLKLGYIKFTDDAFLDNNDIHIFENTKSTTLDLSEGTYVALEGYYNIWQNIYAGFEVGYTETEDDIADFHNNNRQTAHISMRNTLVSEFSFGLEYIPLQINAKYCIEPIDNLALSFGGGLSYNRAKTIYIIEIPSDPSSSGSESESDWLWGGQIFASAVYKIHSFFVGLDATYQVTEDWDDDWDGEVESVNFNNYRISATVGYHF